MKDYCFSDAQALGALTSTGVVSTNVFDMELDASGGNTILTNDQLVGILNLIFPANANQVGGTEGMNILLRSCDNANMTSSCVELATLFISATELTTGCVKTVGVCVPLTQCFVGIFYDPVSTTLTTGNTVDAWFDIAPITVNDSSQKVPS
jgi:hypothetical protein